ncbi:Histone-fold-containing protein [Naviculisporaceae sp. PSN 640]
MPYNTTAIPPRKEVTGQTQLPLTRVKKIISVDPDVNICSNNAAFVITLATEMFIQHVAQEAQNMAKLERKPRRNIQYKDLANTIAHHDHLEFLEDIVPRTTPFKAVKAKAAATRAKVKGEKVTTNDDTNGEGVRNGDSVLPILNGSSSSSSKKPKSNGTPTTNGTGRSRGPGFHLSEEDPNAQLELEMRQASQHHLSQQNGDGDVDMTG